MDGPLHGNPSVRALHRGLFLQILQGFDFGLLLTAYAVIMCGACIYEAPTMYKALLQVLEIQGERMVLASMASVD